MRFLMLMIPTGYEKATPAALPPKEAVEAMQKYSDSLCKAGVLLTLDGLRPPAEGVRLTRAGGKLKVTDGPFTETKEALGGYWMLQVKSKEEAIEWASRCPAVQPYAPDGVATIELRQLQETSDWPAERRAVVNQYPELQKLQQIFNRA
ncbi:MAG: YciI family protein [Deltaproteobacteria bacterium]